MTFELRTEIVIDATPEKVWRVLTDFASYPEWNPFITSLKGDVQVGNRIAVRIEPPGASASNFKPRVTAFEPNKLLGWIGVLLFPGFFDGEHRFELHELENGKTHLIQQEKFSGLLVPLFRKMLNTSIRKGFEAFNDRLKKRAEAEYVKISTGVVK